MNNGKLSLYELYKDKMRTGDLLQWKGYSLGWRCFRLITSAKNFNHSSMILGLKEYEKLERKRFTTEARVLRGTVLNRLSHRLDQYDGEVWWFPLKESWNSNRKGIGDQMLERIGISYDLAGASWWTVRRLFGARCRKVFQRTGLKRFVNWMKRRPPRIEEKEVFCSEYCYLVYESAGNLPNKLSELPLPDDMENLGIFKERTRIL